MKYEPIWSGNGLIYEALEPLMPWVATTLKYSTTAWGTHFYLSAFNETDTAV